MEDVKEQWEEGVKMSCVWMRSRTDLISLGLVRRGHVSQILDHLLGVLCLTSTRLSSVRQRNTESKNLVKVCSKLETQSRINQNNINCNFNVL